MAKKTQEIEEVEVIEEVSSAKQHLLNLYQELKDLGVRSISDLENLIARAE